MTRRPYLFYRRRRRAGARLLASGKVPEIGPSDTLAGLSRIALAQLLVPEVSWFAGILDWQWSRDYLGQAISRRRQSNVANIDD
jgi:hypothetical protein